MLGEKFALQNPEFNVELLFIYFIFLIIHLLALS